MKKFILVLVFLLVGCFSQEEEKDSYSSRKSLLPEDVTELVSVCKKQPNFYRSTVIVRHGEAKGVICTYYNSESRGSSYHMDASVLKIKMQERQEQKNRDSFGEDK